MTSIDSEREYIEDLGPLRLLDCPEVRTELKISNEHFRRYEALVREVEKEIPLPRDGWAVEERVATVRAHIQRVNAEVRRRLTRVISPEQNRRLEGLVLQIGGADRP